MPVQTRNDVLIRQLLLSGEPMTIDSATFLTNASATVPIATRTVVAKNPTTGKWVPLTDVTVADGTEMPRGILLGAITAAKLVAGDVPNQRVIVGGVITVDKDLLVLENSLTLSSIISGQVVAIDTTDTQIGQMLTVEDALMQIGIFPEAVDQVSQLENA